MVKLEKDVVLHSEDLVLSLWSQKLTLSVLYKPGIIAVFVFCWTKVHFDEPLLCPVLEFG